MATMTEYLKHAQNDYGVPLSITLYEADGVTPKNLAGYTVTLKVWSLGVPGTLILSGTCTVDVAANGTCHYTPVAGNFPTVGVYYAECELTAAGVVDSTIPFTLEVVESA